MLKHMKYHIYQSHLVPNYTFLLSIHPLFFPSFFARANRGTDFCHTLCTFNSYFGFYFNSQKKYTIQSENIIMGCEFDAKMYLDAQNIKQFWYWASALEFLLIAYAHLTTHDHTNSFTHIWYPEH